MQQVAFLRRTYQISSKDDQVGHELMMPVECMCVVQSLSIHSSDDVKKTFAHTELRESDQPVQQRRFY